MNAEESRKQFEAAVLTGDLLPVNSVRRNYMDYRAGGYESILTNVAWLAWQAAKAQAVPEGNKNLLQSLRDMVEIVGANFCSNQEIKQKYRAAFNLINDLEQCK